MIEVKCPSGLAFSARFWTNKDRQIIIGHKHARSGSPLARMVSVVTLEILDPGPYELSRQETIDWQNVTMEDMFAALVQIRKSRRPIIEFSITCQCGAEIPIKKDLNDLEIRPHSDMTIELIKTGGLYQVDDVLYKSATGDTPEERISVALRTLRVRDMSVLQRHQRDNPERLFDAQLVLQISEISRGDGSKITGFLPIWNFFEEGSWEFRDELMSIGEELDADAGVEMSFDIQCRSVSCGMEGQAKLPFGLEFFYPSRSTSGSSSSSTPKQKKGQRGRIIQPR